MSSQMKPIFSSEALTIAKGIQTPGMTRRFALDKAVEKGLLVRNGLVYSVAPKRQAVQKFYTDLKGKMTITISYI